jgi:hypothetical protein
VFAGRQELSCSFYVEPRAGRGRRLRYCLTDDDRQFIEGELEPDVHRRTVCRGVQPLRLAGDGDGSAVVNDAVLRLLKERHVY